MGPSSAVMPPFLPDAVAQRVLMRVAGMGLRRHQHGDHGGLARLNLRR